jgi:hypothetical protein
VYIDTGSSVPGVPSKSRDLADDNNKILTEWKWFEIAVLNTLSIHRVNKHLLLFFNAACLVVKTATINFIVFGLTRREIEPMFYSTQKFLNKINYQ